MFTKTLLPDTFRAIQLISKIPTLRTAYLAGGTALALQLGHRISVDLDFFTPHEFLETDVEKTLTKVADFKTDQVSTWTILGTIGKTKFSFFYYKYPLIAPTVDFEGIRLASLKDIAAMKINALESRGTRRDFIDVYTLIREFTLEEMFEFYNQKYSGLTDHIYSILRALDYFEDAEKESQMPQMLIPLDWDKVKTFFQNEVRRLAKTKLEI